MRLEFCGLLGTLGIALLWSSPSLGAFIYRAEAVEGWVVDAETGKSIEGVVVVAHWRLWGGMEGGTPIRELKILESVTDHNGRYTFPAWGPKFALMGTLLSESPEILMFKEGYKYQRLLNQWHPDLDTSKSEWNRKTVKLERFTGTLEQYQRQNSMLNSDLWTTGYGVGDHWGDHCGWKAFPQMLRALDRLDEKFKALPPTGIRSVTATLRSNERKLRSAGCGTVDELLGR